ncbi:putative transcription factor lepB [Exophiala dermatitidis]
MSLNSQKPRTSHPNLKRPRQEPVSCQFCRSKKLKCDRQQPCSNCVTRGLPCDGHGQPPHKVPAQVEGQNDSILARLKRLEEIVLGPSATNSIGVNQIPQLSSGLPQSRPTTSPVTCATPASEYEEAVHTLENLGTREGPWCPPSYTGPVFRIASTHHIASTYGFTQGRANQTRQESRYYFLPPRDEAIVFMDFYASNVSDLQHVIYIPRARAIMDSLYQNLEQGLSVAHSDAALMLSIFSSSAAILASEVDELQYIFKNVDPNQAAMFWADCAIELVDFSRRTGSPGLEDIQTSIIVGFLLYHMEGFTGRCRFLFVGAIGIARDMGMHRLDAPTSQPPQAWDSAVALEMEIKRRVWWHVVATDWLISLNGGPQEGTYLVHPRQMIVNLPRNVDDEHLAYDGPPIDMPLSEPTAMSYYLQRIKLADICRSIVDVMPLSTPLVTQVDYQEIIALDRRFEAFFENLPIFLRTDEKSRLASAEILRRYPHMRIQRYTLSTVGLIRRCKLHQPFLIRRSAQGNYSYSRNVSLQCARSVIALKNLLDSEDGGTIVGACVKPGIVAYHIFMATIVLVMDLCFNRDEGDDAARKAEVREACNALEECLSRSSSGTSFQLINSLMDTLRKHKVRLHNLSGEVTQRAAAQESMPVFHTSGLKDALPLVKQSSDQPANAWFQDTTQNTFTDFDEIWKEYVENGPNMDMPDWDSLFNDLDARVC